MIEFSVTHLRSKACKDIREFIAANDDTNMKLLREMKILLRTRVRVSEVALVKDGRLMFNNSGAHLDQ